MLRDIISSVLLLISCSGAAIRCAPVAMQLKALHRSNLDSLITSSLDRHAQRGQKLGLAVQPALLRLSSATKDDWCRVVDALAPFMKERRVRRLQAALAQRRAGLELVVDSSPREGSHIVRCIY